MIEIVKSENFDFEHYEYAICECTLWGEGIQIPRKEYNDFVGFNCPRCGKSLGMYVRGYKESTYNILIDNDLRYGEVELR